MEVQTSKGTKCGSQAAGGSTKKRKGSKATGEEEITLTEHDLNQIADTVTIATEDMWMDIEA